MSKKETKLSRRDLLKSATVAGAGLGLSGWSFGNESNKALAEWLDGPKTANASVMDLKFEPRERVRLGVIGVGARGLSMLDEFLGVDHVEITAVCDIVKDKVTAAQRRIEKAGQKTPAGYSSGDHDYENLVKRDDIDFVYIATPWDWHVEMAIAAMTSGKHAGVEVPVATTLEDCWKIVDTSEKTRRHCMIMENCCYGYNEMMVLNMARAGLFGDLVHAEAAYLHDLRELLFEDQSEGLWRRFPHIKRDGNLYPTHGLGPVARYLGIHQGDRFDHLVSMSSLSVSLPAYRETHIPADSPKRKERYRCGDMNTSLIKTARGRTIMLQHTVTTPRPYDRLNLISGTKGIFRDYPPRLYFDGQEGGEKWTTIDAYKEKYEHALWKNIGEIARKRGGHGGMDFIMVYRLIDCMRKGLAPDLNVYDAAAWSAPGPLSELSVGHGSMPVKFPDFTRGRWQQAQ
ncbi:MAG: Gfo/Idh/MocA family oxidoreductase [Blastocatellia bacterium]